MQETKTLAILGYDLEVTFCGLFGCISIFNYQGVSPYGSPISGTIEIYDRFWVWSNVARSIIGKLSL